MPEDNKEGKIPQTQQELEEAAKALGIAPEPTPPEPQEIEIKLETGEVYKGKNYEEIVKAIAKGKEEATRTIRDRERQISDLKGKVPVHVEPEEKFNNTRYYELMAEDPMKAWQYQMSFVMGVPPEEVVNVMRYQQAIAKDVDMRIQNAIFREVHPEAPYGDDFADVMVERMDQRGRVWSAENLGSTFLELVHEGKLKVVEQEKPGETKEDNPPPTTGSSKGSSTAEDIVGNFEKLSTKDQEEYLKKHGLL